MLDEHEMICAYTGAIARFNQGDIVGFGELLADACSLISGEQVIGHTRQAFLDALVEGRGRGWIRQVPVSVASAGHVLVTTYSNHFADGTSVQGGGVLLFDDAGKVSAVRTLGTRMVEPQAT